MQANKNEVRMEVGMDTISIEAQGSKIHIDTHQVYTAIRRIFAEEDIRCYLADEGYTEQQIESLVTEKFVNRWLYAISNNECIAEAKQLAAANLAEELA